MQEIVGAISALESADFTGNRAPSGNPADRNPTEDLTRLPASTFAPTRFNF